jgi:hypothetical protein
MGAPYIYDICRLKVKPCFVIIWFNLYAAFIPTEEASFTAKNITDSQKPCLGEEKLARNNRT